MTRVAVSIAFAFLGTLAAVLLYERQAPAAAPVAGQQEVIERLDRLERAIIQIGAQAQPDEPQAEPAVEVLTPPLPTPHNDARQSAIRAGNGIVDRAMGVTRWTIEDAKELAAATVVLDGPDRAELFARVSAAINAEQLQVDARALGF